MQRSWLHSSRQQYVLCGDASPKVCCEVTVYTVWICCEVKLCPVRRCCEVTICTVRRRCEVTVCTVRRCYEMTTVKKCSCHIAHTPAAKVTACTLQRCSEMTVCLVQRCSGRIVLHQQQKRLYAQCRDAQASEDTSNRGEVIVCTVQAPRPISKEASFMERPAV